MTQSLQAGSNVIYSLMVGLISVAVVGCSVKPKDDIGLTSAGLALVEFEAQNLHAWKFDGREAIRFPYTVSCRPGQTVGYEGVSCYSPSEVVVANLEGQIVSRQPFPKNRPVRAAKPSPDGKKIAFWSTGRSGQTSLFVQLNESAVPVQDSQQPATVFPGPTPAFWNATSDQLYFESAGVIRAYGTVTGKVEALIKGTHPAVSPNGNELLFGDPAGGLSIMHLGRKSIRRLSTSGGLARWSIDGQFVFFSRPRLGPCLVIVNLSSGKVQEESFPGEDLPIDRMALVRVLRPGI